MNVIGMGGWEKMPGTVVHRGVVLNLTQYARRMWEMPVNFRRSVPRPKVTMYFGEVSTLPYTK